MLITKDTKGASALRAVRTRARVIRSLTLRLRLFVPDLSTEVEGPAPHSPGHLEGGSDGKQE